MNKAQIKAELRRSATEDREPYFQADLTATNEANDYFNFDDVVFGDRGNVDHEQDRWYFLLVAEAL